MTRKQLAWASVTVAIAILLYATAGFLLAANGIASADAAVNTLVSHQVEYNTTFQTIDSEFSLLSASSVFSAAEGINQVDRFVSTTNAAQGLVESDDAALAGASSRLYDQQWLTLLLRGNLDREVRRIVHARSALSNAQIVVSDYMLDGQFLENLYHALFDLDSLSTAAGAGDVAGAQTALSTLKAHVDGALQQSAAPGLPPEVHDLMAAFHVMVGDFGKFVGAMKTGDAAARSASQASIAADGGKLAAFDFDTIRTEVDAFYRPLQDRFNAEIAASTF